MASVCGKYNLKAIFYRKISLLLFYLNPYKIKKEVNEKMKKAAVFLADGFEEVEALTPVDYLRRAGVEVITVAVPSDRKSVV